MGSAARWPNTAQHPPQEAAMSLLLPNRRRFISALASLPAWVRLPEAQAAPALLLAQTAPAGIDPTGYLVSEKYDGVRALWDGHTLRFRSGLKIAAPDTFVQRLPAVPLDGELWLGRGRFELLSGLVRRQSPDAAAWRQLQYMVFELPGASGSFASRARRIAELVQHTGWPQLRAVKQEMLASPQALRQRLDEVIAAGGEGLMLHRAEAPYETGRSASLLKFKPLHDAEAWVIGHVAGRGRHAGRMGALQVRSSASVAFLLGTGFSDAQRDSPPPIGTLVSYTHRGFTADGVPRFASFLRVRSEHF
jgi:DNA ligase 1